MVPKPINARLVRRIGKLDYVILAFGTISGRGASRFLRSFVQPDVSVECSQDGRRWRWIYTNKRGGSVDKVSVY